MFFYVSGILQRPFLFHYTFTLLSMSTSFPYEHTTVILYLGMILGKYTVSSGSITVPCPKRDLIHHSQVTSVVTGCSNESSLHGWMKCLILSLVNIFFNLKSLIKFQSAQISPQILITTKMKDKFMIGIFNLHFNFSS